MEIGPIFRALIRSKTRFFLVVTEIALTLAIVVNCLNMIADQREYLIRPTGMDEENLLAITSEPFAPEFEDRAYALNAYREDLASLRSMPGVRAAMGIDSIPLSGSGSATSRRPLGSEGETTAAPYYVVSEGAVETLGIEIVAGRDFEAADWLAAEEREQARIDAQAAGEKFEAGGDEIYLRNVLITRTLADLLFPEGDALGKVIANRSENSRQTIVGIIGEMHCSWPISNLHDRVLLFPDLPYSDRRSRYMVRAEDGMGEALHADLERRLLAVNEGRILTVKTLMEVKQENMEETGAMIKMLGGISVLLVVVTSLGIIGLTAFSVTQRTRQIGTRRALGATRWNVLRYFLVENLLITTIGLGLGLILTYVLNFTLAQMAGLPMIGFPLVGAGMALLWSVGLTATLVSAFRSMSISPVLATRTI